MSNVMLISWLQQYFTSSTDYRGDVPLPVLVGWLCFRSHGQQGHLETAPPFTAPCEGCEARFLHRPHRESNPGPLRGSPLYYRCTTPAPLCPILKEFWWYEIVPELLKVIWCDPCDSLQFYVSTAWLLTYDFCFIYPIMHFPL